MMAAATAGRDLLYFTFDDKDLTIQVRKIYKKLKSRTVSQVFHVITRYKGHTNLDNHTNSELSFRDYLLNHIGLNQCSIL